MYRSILTILLLLASCTADHAALCAQVFSSSTMMDIHRFEQLTVEQGLPMNSVNMIAQDRIGFLWFATQDGLCRYEATGMKIFRHKDDDSTSLPSNFVQSILVASDGTILAGTAEGLAVYQPITETFRVFRHHPKDSLSLANNYVIHLYEDSKHRVWAITRDGLTIYHLSTRTITTVLSKYNRPAFMQSLDCVSLCEYFDGSLLLGTRKGIYHIDSETFQVRPTTELSTLLKQTTIDPDTEYATTLYRDRRGALWICTFDKGLYVIDAERKGCTTYRHHPDNPMTLSSNESRTICEDRNGIMWVGTYKNGLNVLNPTSGMVQRFQNITPHIGSPPVNDLRQIFIDRGNIVWIGTDYGGVLKVDPHVQRIRTYRRNVSSPRPNLRDNVIRTMAEDYQGNWWIGTGSGGLHKYAPLTQEWNHWQRDSLQPYKGIAGNSIWSIIPAKDSTYLWIGSNEGLQYFHIPSGRVTRTYRLDSTQGMTSVPMNFVRTMCLAPNGDVWIGVRTAHIARLNIQTGQFFLHKINATNIHDMLIDNEGILWVGTWAGGLWSFDANTGKPLASYLTDPSNPRSIPTNIIRSLFQDSKGQLWLGTMVGLIRFNKSTGNCTLYSEKDGLPNNTIYKILEDRYGNFWISTNKGICRLSLPTMEIRVYNKSSGMQDNEFNALAGWKLRSGAMMFGGINGFSIFHPDSLLPNLTPPSVIVTDFRVFNKPYQLDTSIVLKNSITLRHNENFFTFRYSALDYTATGLHRFQYRMIGFDSQWIDAGSTLEATYTNLDPGTYTFQVIAANSDGTWNTTGRSITIIIVSPWWATWWFRTILGMLVFILIVLTIRYRIHRLKYLNTLLNTQVKERTTELLAKNDELRTLNQTLHQANTFKSKMLTIVSHDLKNPLSNILGFTYLLKDDEMPAPKRSEFLAYIDDAVGKMHSLIVDLLDVAAHEHGKINLEYVPSTLHDIVFDLVVKYRVNAYHKQQTIEYQNTTEALVWCDKARLEQVFDNLLSNAVKYSYHGGYIYVNISETDTIIQCSITDQGQGFTAEDMDLLFHEFQTLSARPTGGEHSSGVGLSIAKQIVELHQGSIHAESAGKNQGATFIVTLKKYSPPIAREQNTDTN
jgi:ligand-binding sensor domain-containing protein/signal transduction histidine kinase